MQPEHSEVFERYRTEYLTAFAAFWDENAERFGDDRGLLAHAAHEAARTIIQAASWEIDQVNRMMFPSELTVQGRSS